MNWNRVIHRYIFVLLGGFIAMAIVMVVSFGSRAGLSTPQLWSNVLGISLTFAHILAFATTTANEIPLRIRHLPVIVQAIIAAIAGFAFNLAAWAAYHVLFLANTSPDWFMLSVGAIALTIPLVVATLWRNARNTIRIPVLIILSILSTLLAIGVYQQQYLDSIASGTFSSALFFFDSMRDFWLAIPAFSLIIALFTFIPTLWIQNDLMRQEDKQKRKTPDASTISATNTSRLEAHYVTDNAENSENDPETYKNMQKTDRMTAES